MKKFYLVKAFFAAAIAVLSCIPALDAQVYEESPLDEEGEVSEERFSTTWDSAEIGETTAEYGSTHIAVSTDPVTQSFRFFTEALVDEYNNDIDKAISGFKKAIEAVPDNLYIYQHATRMALESGRYADAEKWSEYIIQKDSTTSQNWVLYANSKWANEHYDEAAEGYRQALKLSPDNAEALYQYASLVGDDMPDLAISMFQKCKALLPDEASDIDYRIAILYNVKNNLPKTEEYLLKSIKENLSNTAAWYAIVDLYEIRKQPEKALEALEALVIIDPGNVKALKRIAETYMESEPEKAEEYFRKIKEVDKSDPDACFWLAAAAEEAKDYEEAARQLEDSASLWVQPELLMRLSFFYTQIGKYDEAVDLMEDAHDKFPDNKDIAYYLALGLDDTGKSLKAYDYFDWLVRIEPENLDYRYQLAQVCQKVKKFDEMETHFKYILSQQPENAVVLNYLGYSLAEQDLKLEEAKSYIEKALKISPNEGAYIDSWAWVNYRLGNLDIAKEYIIKAKDLVPNDQVIWEHYGDIFNSLEDLQEAWKAWQIANILSLFDKSGEERPLKGKIEKLERRLSAKSAAIMKTAYLDKFIAHGNDYSAYGKLEAEAGGKNIKVDVIINFTAPDHLKITFLSPFYTPAGFVSVSGEEFSVSGLPELPGMEKYSENIKSWLGVIAMDFRDVYMGRYNKANVRNWKKKDYVSEYGAKVRLGAFMLPDRIRSSRNRKIEMNISDYHLFHYYFLPSDIEFKVPYTTVRITIDPSKMKYKPENNLRDFVNY